MYYKDRKPSPSSESHFHCLESPDKQLQIMQLPGLRSNYFQLKVKWTFPKKREIYFSYDWDGEK